LNSGVPRVESGKNQGLFSKKYRLNRYLRSGAVRSRSDGQDFMSAGSNLGRVYRIGRSMAFGREGRRRCSRSAAARGRGAAGVRPSGAPGVNPTRAWVGWHPRGMRKPLEAKAWLGRAWAGLATARGGRRGGASPACGVPGAKAVYGPSYLAKATREALGAHQGSNRAGAVAERGHRRGPAAAVA